jgi:hypothetical protein
VTNTKNSSGDETSKEVVTTVPEYRNSDLQGISTFDDALALLRETYGNTGIIAADEVIGSGFGLLTNKDLLVGVPFVILKWQFYPGKFTSEFSTCMVVTTDGRKYLVNDGGTGICKQLTELTAETGRQGGLVARKGLSRSDYTYTDERGEESPATTYYIDTSAAM